MTEIMAVRWNDLLELPDELSASKSGAWPIAEAMLLSGVTEAEGGRDSVCGVWVLQFHGSVVPHCQHGCEDVGRW